MVYQKLRGKIKEAGLTESELAKRLNISNASLSFRLNGKQDWTNKEMQQVCNELGIPLSDCYLYFFAN